MTYLIQRPAIDSLIAVLRDRGYTVIGPTVRSGTVLLEDIASSSDLPAGMADEQGPGRYRLIDRDDDALFGQVVGPESVKRYLHPPEAVLVRAERNGAGFRSEGPSAAPTFAFFGVRPCDLAAVAVQDRVFVGGAHRDATYGDRRDGAIFIVANCTVPGGSCFCASMGSGPRAMSGFDLALTEVKESGQVWYLVDVGSEVGEELMTVIDSRQPTPQEEATVDGLLRDATESMGRTLDTAGLADLLSTTLESPRWEEIATRCLTCANCTLVCPTCFCATVDDETSLTGEEAIRVRRWDSCFNEEFSYIHGGPLRPSPSARYRQWLTHKLSTWVDQFDTLGCVGCGRCITWCPVGIDLTAEAAALRKEVIDV